MGLSSRHHRCKRGYGWILALLSRHYLFIFYFFQILLFLSWCIIAGSRGRVLAYGGNSGFFLWSSVIPWLIFLVIFVLMMLNLHTKIARFINIHITVSYLSFLNIFCLLFISSIVQSKRMSNKPTFSSRFSLVKLSCYSTTEHTTFVLFNVT